MTKIFLSLLSAAAIAWVVASYVWVPKHGNPINSKTINVQRLYADLAHRLPTYVAPPVVTAEAAPAKQ